MLVIALWQDELQMMIALDSNSQSLISDPSNGSTFEVTDSDISDPITAAQYSLLALVPQ